MVADPPSSTGTPRWVKVFGVITVLLIVLFVVLLVSGVRHGPSRHTAPFSIADDAVQRR
jgi:hypothetical protein